MNGRLLFEPGRGLGFVDVIVVLGVGSEADPPGREGLAHLALRTLRMGTPEKSRAEMDAEIERLGAHLETGASLYRCVVRGRVIRENLERFAELLCDLAMRPAMREEDFERARALTSAELVAMRDDDRAMAGRAFRKALFDDHPAGRPSSGTVASVARIARDDVVKWHGAAFARDRLLVGVAGDVTEEEAERLVAGPLRGLPEKAALEPAADRPPRRPRGRRIVLVDKPERTQAQIYVGHLGPRPAHPDHTAMLASSVAFGGTFSARLMQEVRVKRGWSYGAYSRLARSKDDDAFYLWTFPATADAANCLSLELDMLRSLRSDGITEAELDFARGYIIGSSVFLIDTPADRLERRIEVETLGFPKDYYTSLRSRVEAVTIEQARAATRDHVHPDDLVVAMLCTAREVEDSVRRAAGDGAEIEILRFDDEML